MKIKQGMEADYAKYKEINSGDPYSARVVSYGEDWANLMERRIEGHSAPDAIEREIKSCAKRTSSEADTDGITGYMYGAAISALAHFWEHGEILRRWHNREYLDEEKAAIVDKNGGTVNPAILTIG